MLFSSPLPACCMAQLMFTQLPNHQRESLKTSTGGRGIKIHIFHRDLQNANQDQQIKQSMQIWLTVIAGQGWAFLSVEVEQNFKHTTRTWITLSSLPSRAAEHVQGQRLEAAELKSPFRRLFPSWTAERPHAAPLCHTVFAPCCVAGTVQLAGPPASSPGLQPLTSRWALLDPWRGKENAQLL